MVWKVKQERTEQVHGDALKLKVAYIGVASSFLAEASLRAMPGNKHGVVAHGPQSVANAIDQCFMVATWEVGAAHAAHEQHIAYKSTFGLLGMKHHMARRVARTVANIQGAIANLNRVAINQPAVGLERFAQGEVEHAALVGQAVDPELVALVRTDDGQV